MKYVVRNACYIGVCENCYWFANLFMVNFTYSSEKWFFIMVKGDAYEEEFVGYIFDND